MTDTVVSGLLLTRAGMVSAHLEDRIGATEDEADKDAMSEAVSVIQGLMAKLQPRLIKDWPAELEGQRHE